MLIRAKMPSTISASTHMELAKINNDEIAEGYRMIINKEMVLIAKAWRTQAKIDLSGPCSPKNRALNYTAFPGKCTGSLEYNLRHRTLVTRRAGVVSAGYFRRFLPFVSKQGFNYAEHLNNSSMPYGGYQERIYEALDKEIALIIHKYNSTGDRFAWLHR